MDYQKNKEYFYPPTNDPANLFGVAFIVVSLIVGYMCFIGGVGVGIAVVLLIIGIILLCYHHATKKPKPIGLDQAYDDRIKEYISSLNLQEKALLRLGVDESQVDLIDPVVIHGPIYANVTNKQYIAKKGEDNKTRSSSYKVLYIFFSETEIYYYTYIFSTIADECREATGEYFYKDIVSVTTETVNREYEKGKTYTGETFVLTTTGGTNIEALIDNEDIAMKKIIAMKQLIREKKFV